MTNKEIFERLSDWDLPQIQLSQAEIKYCLDWGEAVVKQKQKLHDKTNGPDTSQWPKRFATGKAGEVAVERLLGIKFTDDRIGHTKDKEADGTGKFTKNDLAIAGFEVGVKTSNLGLVPTYFPSEAKKGPQIIVILRRNDYDYDIGDLATVYGVATKDTLLKYGSPDLVATPAMRRKGKVGFYGFEKLERFENKEELIKILSKE